MINRPCRALSLVAVVLLAAAPAFSAEAKARPATVLLLTSKNLAGAWKPFADWKTRQGKAAEILTVEQIAKEYKGKDIQQKIRNAVQAYIAKRGTKWVILGGDSQPGGKGVVPHRSTRHAMLGRARTPRFPGPGKMGTGGPDLPTDLYYISPPTHDWDANDDGKYGDWKTDRKAIAYTHPSGACIGRIPVRSAADVKAYTDKVIGYESRYPAKDFAAKFLYTNTTNGSEPKVRRSWDGYISKAWPGGKVFRFFHTSTPWDKSLDQKAPKVKRTSYPLNAANWSARIASKTASKMHMHGHGMPQFWVLEHRSGRSLVTSKVAGNLANLDAYLTITTVSCFTGQFDTAGDPCIAETMLRAPNRGAVLIVAPSRPGVPIFHNPRRDFPLMIREGKLDGTTETMTRFWVHALTKQPDGRYLTAGQAMASVKADMAPHAAKTEGYHMIQCELNLLGDPTLDLRACDPVTPALKAPKSLTAGKQTLNVTTSPGAMVCGWKGDEVYAVALANMQGKASLKIAPTTAGKLLLTACGPCFNTVCREITIRKP